jgi:hypothetical protein
VVFGGDFREVVSFGGEQLQSAGEFDVYIAKLDPSGNHLGSDRFGDAMDQHLADLAVDTAGHAVVVGSYFGVIDFGFGPLESAGETDLYVAKLQP